MKVEVPLEYRTEAIAYAASNLVDELAKTKVSGTELWPHVKDSWLDHIMGLNPHNYDLTAHGLRVGYRTGFDYYQSKARSLENIELLLSEPRIIIKADEQVLTTVQAIDVSNVLQGITSSYTLRPDLPPQTLIFPKEVFAGKVVTFTLLGQKLS